MRNHLTRPQDTSAMRRGGFTLAETLIATAIVAMMTAALGSLVYASTGAATRVTAVRQTQHHGRRCSERLQKLIRSAHSGRTFPGAMIVKSTSDGRSFFDVLALWISTTGSPEAPNGRPRVREILFIGPSPAAPSKLMQFRRMSDDWAPSWNDAAGWTALARSVCNDPSATTEVWTDLVHTASFGNTTRGNVHFSRSATPSLQEWQDYLDGTRTWNQLNWSGYGGGSSTGVRVTNIRFEMQLKAPTEQGAALSDFDRGVFFGAENIKTVLEK